MKRTENIVPQDAAACLWLLGAKRTGALLGAAALLVFAALPTAQSCYVMTASMRGNAPIVAEVTTAHTLAAMVTLPVWVAVIQNVFLAG